MVRARTLVVSVLLLLAPWPVLAMCSKPRGSPALVAVASDGSTLGSPVAASFSRARYFVIVDLRSMAFKAVPNPYADEERSLGLKAAEIIGAQEVGIVLTRHMGAEPRNAVIARGVQVYSGGPQTALEAVWQYRDGTLARLAPPPPLDRRGRPLPLIEPSPPQVSRVQHGILAGQALPWAPTDAPRPGAAAAVPQLGIEVGPAGTDGVAVSRVYSGASGATAGLLPGDVILKMNGRRVSDVSRFLSLVSASAGGSLARLAVARGGGIVTTTAVVVAAPFAAPFAGPAG